MSDDDKIIGGFVLPPGVNTQQEEPFETIIKTPNELDDDTVEKLNHYANRPVTEFSQYDGHSNNEGSIADTYDEQGETVDGGTTFELMYGASVRVLVRHDTDKASALRLLKEIIKWIEKDNLFLSEEYMDKDRKRREKDARHFAALGKRSKFSIIKT